MKRRLLCTILYSTRVRINRRVLFIHLHYFASPLAVGFIPDGSLAQLNVKSKNPIRRAPGLPDTFTATEIRDFFFRQAFFDYLFTTDVRQLR